MSTDQQPVEPESVAPVGSGSDAAVQSESVQSESVASDSVASDSVAAAAVAAPVESAELADPAELAEVEPEPVEIAHAPVEVGLQRSVRFGRIIVVATALGALVAAIACFFFPVTEEAEYTMAQIVGFMLLIGAAIGLTVGALLSLILALAVRNRRGAAMATQIDVR